MPGMLDRLGRSQAAVLIVLAMYFAANVVVRLNQPASLEYDEAHQLFLAQWLFAGIDSQPPFYNWLQYAVVHLFGSSLASLSVLKNAMLFCCYVLYALAAGRLLKDKALAAIATLGLLTIPQISYETQRDLTHTVAALFASCLFFYCLVRTLERPSLWNYILTGIAVGIGAISKYNFVLFPIVALLAMLPEREFRSRLLDWKIVVALLAAAVVAAPHAYWFLTNWDLATTRTVGKLTQDAASSWPMQVGQGLVSLVEALVSMAAPSWLLFFVAFGRSLIDARSAHSPWTRLIERMFLMLVAALLVMVLFGGVSNVKSRWLIPFFFLLPLYFCLKIDASGVTLRQASQRMAAVAILIMVTIPAVLYARSTSIGALEHYGKQHVPYGPAVAEILATSPVTPALIVTGEAYLPGNIRLHAPDIPVVSRTYPPSRENYPFDADHPWLLVWRNMDGTPSPEVPPRLKEWLETDQRLKGAVWTAGMVAPRYNYGKPGDIYSFSYAWIYPSTN
ncbi:MAG: glycosyltransferase family 39 protein [Rhizobiaceae bacterium]|nr:glycosyltransferase family 39 protein [Rhizobiaceae bacterium]